MQTGKVERQGLAFQLIWRNPPPGNWQMFCACNGTIGDLHDGYLDAGARLRLLRACDWLRLRLRTVVRRSTMIFDYSLAGLVSLGLLFYLTYALLRPERF